MAKSAMQMHARDAHRSETKPHQCQQCLKSFSSNHQLVQHIRVHTGEKPYRCSYCDRRFKQLSHVQQHTRLHTGQSRFLFYYFEEENQLENIVDRADMGRENVRIVTSSILSPSPLWVGSPVMAVSTGNLKIEYKFLLDRERETNK